MSETPSSTQRPPSANDGPSSPGKKFIIQMSGPPGAGKSTLARNLAAEMRRRAGLAAVVINHDLIKAFFLEPPAYPATSSPPELGVSFTDAAKLSYKLDWVLAMDMFMQGQDVVIVDSVCNYREAVEHGLDLAKRWNSTPCRATAGSENNDACSCKDCDSEMRYVYVECRFGGDSLGGNEEGGDLRNFEALDQRLRERARQSGALSSQRRGVWEGPTGDSQGRGSPSDVSEEAVNALFSKWMNPTRPTAEDGATVVVVDSKNKSTDECAGIVLRELGLSDLDVSEERQR